jgi:LuxR family transcriptional regulator, maltose regulon positive regulatory protein
MMRWPHESRPTEPVRAAGGMLTARPAGGHHSGPGGSHHGALLLASKLCPPVRRPGAVVRQALLDRLSEDLPARLVVVSAPAGWGKTSLLRDWRLADESSRTAWVSVDPGDNDPVRFWAHVVAGLAGGADGFGALAVQALRAPGTSLTGVVLPILVNELAGLAAPVTLVLDDYHLISSRGTLHSVAFLVEHLPPAVRLVVATRMDPELPLPRLRARGEMLELRADDLRFTERETAALLNGTLGLALAAADIAALHQRTEGWAAGLCLAGLSLRGLADPSAFIRAFAGDDRQIVDYLLAEVLDGLPAEVREFLLRTSVLDQLSGPLCDAVVGGDGAQHLLEEMERSSLFLVRLDARRRWYRYHHLFAELLRHELDRAEPGLAALLHRRACAWHQAQGNVAEAIGHAISAGDLADARELIAGHWNVCFNEGLVETVESWLNRLPPEMVAHDARLCLVRAWLARHLGRLDEVEPWVEAAEAGTAQGPLREGVASIESAACMLRAGYRQMIGDLAGAELPSRRAVALEGSGTPRWRAAAVATLGANLCWQGRYCEAVAILGQVAAAVGPLPNNLAGVWAMGCLAALHSRAGDLEAAQLYARKATTLAAEHALSEYWITATAVITMADLLDRQGQAAEAGAAALRGLELARRGRARLETACALLCLARIRFHAGDAGDARARLGAAREIITVCPDPGVLTEDMARTERALTARTASAGLSRCRLAEPLSQREREVLLWLNSQLSLREIASKLFVSYYTVKTHTRHIYRKLGVSTRQQAVSLIRDSDIG